MPATIISADVVLWGGVLCFALVVAPPALRRFCPTLWAYFERDERRPL